MKRRCGKNPLYLLGLGLLPLTLLLRELAFRYPVFTDEVYGGWIYPHIAFILGRLNDIFPFSLAEAIGLLSVPTLLVGVAWRRKRSASPQEKGRIRWLLRGALRLWILSGIGGMIFLLSWGFNYARPTVQRRLGLPVEGISAAEVLDAGRHAAERTSTLHAVMELPVRQPSRMPVGFRVLNDTIDRRLRELGLPGDPIRYRMSTVKKLISSPLLSYLGISGIFIPFTGEPSMNAMLPDVLVPFVVAHEKAHQRGVTNEGEANLVAFLACTNDQNDPYLSYSAFLFAATHLIGAASVSLPGEAREAWALLGAGPRRDIEAIRTFWSRYEGRVAEIADKINDAYLRSQRVEEGGESYGEVVHLFVALQRQGRFIRNNH